MKWLQSTGLFLRLISYSCIDMMRTRRETGSAENMQNMRTRGECPPSRDWPTSVQTLGALYSLLLKNLHPGPAQEKDHPRTCTSQR